MCPVVTKQVGVLGHLIAPLVRIVSIASIVVMEVLVEFVHEEVHNLQTETTAQVLVAFLLKEKLLLKVV
ncbi:hypothetical protein HX109_06915 [Galbibacter sp. BG1]|uniref:hypothetical protein n=1 Tax=Galbibacter sp. BG1 TaxID=1170699 RepID=UPI0015C1127F|nr:hypothetical protein [Galbibacter sp. BG1]QLE01310.1 hypothetical protein HX109_06915 [Galbibacter sp. BG1]